MQKHIETLRAELRGFGLDAVFIDKLEATISRHGLDGWLGCGSHLRRLGNYVAAAAVYRAGLKVHADSAKLWVNYSVLLLHWGRFKDALSASEKALALDPHDPIGLRTKGGIHKELHEFEDAIRCYEAALRKSAASAADYNTIAHCLIGLGQQTNAVKMLQRALAIDPNYTSALFNLVSIYSSEGWFRDAAPLAARLLQNEPDDLGVQFLCRQVQANASTSVALPPARELREPPEAVSITRGDPRSVGITYSWAASPTRDFAVRLARGLQSQGFLVVLDQLAGLDLRDLLVQLLSCQNIIVVNDTSYVESCLLGRIGASVLSNPYPSFAATADTSEEQFVNAEAIAMKLWSEVSRIFLSEGLENAAKFGYSEARLRLPALRAFVEGWRLDEIQSVFAGLKRFRSLSIAYVGGEHCLSGFPVFDFSSPSYYDGALEALGQTLKAAPRSAGSAPDRGSDLRRKGFGVHADSALRAATLWRPYHDPVPVLRPDVGGGEVHPFMQRFVDWTTT